MPKTTSRSFLWALTIGLAGSGLMVVAAPAEAALQHSRIDTISSVQSDRKDPFAPITCPNVTVPPPIVDPGAPGNGDDPNLFEDNGVAATKTVSTTAETTNSGNLADKINSSASVTTTAKVTSAAGSMATFDLTGNGTATVIPAFGGNSACWAQHAVWTDTRTIFTISQPGWITLAGEADGTPNSAAAPGEYFAWLYVNRLDGVSVNANNFTWVTRSYDGLEISSHKSKHSVTFFAEPGKYLVEGRMYLQASTRWPQASPTPTSFAGSSSRTARFRLQGSFQPAGAKDGKAVSEAKGKKYVALQARNCSTDKVQAKLNKKNLKSAAKVVFKVNGKTRKTVNLTKKFPKKGIVQVGPIADTLAVTVEATVFPKARGAAKPSVKQAYLACS